MKCHAGQKEKGQNVIGNQFPAVAFPYRGMSWEAERGPTLCVVSALQQGDEDTLKLRSAEKDEEVESRGTERMKKKIIIKET